LTGNPACVCIFRQDSRALVSPAEHVGKHTDGIVGCRASSASAGTPAGRTGALDKGFGGFAQAVTSKASSDSVTARRSGGVLSGLDGCIFHSYTAFKFITLFGQRATLCIGGCHALIREGGLGLGMGGLLARQADGLRAKRGQQQAEGDQLEPIGYEAQGIHSTALPTAMACSPVMP